MGKILGIVAACFALALGGCNYLGQKSVPFGSVPINDRDATKFMRENPRIGELSGDLHTRDPLADGRLVGLVVSGGGMRAAAFALGIMDELQHVGNERYDALRDVDFISANSGGGWGAARYLAGARNDRDYPLASHRDEIVGQFVEASKGVVPCWRKRLQDQVLQDVTLGQIYPAGKADPLPAIYFNAAVMPAQAPFVFSDEFIRHYGVTAFHTCLTGKVDRADSLVDLPLAVPATLSSTVPGFYWGYAETSLCSGDLPKAGSLCFEQQPGGARRFLALVDGGLYDNIGYKTAFERIAGGRLAWHSNNDLVIIINANTDTLDHSVTWKDTSNSWILPIAKGTVFPIQNASFQRLYQPMFEAALVNRIVLLDYVATSGFTLDQAGLLDGLDLLAEYAAKRVACFDDHRALQQPKIRRLADRTPPYAESLALLQARGKDCLSENFFRTGTLGKTTYQADEILFKVQWQLGQLAVRMNAAKLVAVAPLNTPTDRALRAQSLVR